LGQKKHSYDVPEITVNNGALGGLSGLDNESGVHYNLDSFSSLPASATKFGGSSTALSRKKQSLPELGNVDIHTTKIKDIIKNHRP